MNYIVALEAGAAQIDFTPLITSLTSAVTPDQVLAIIASVCGVGFTFFLMWFGVRKLTRTFVTSLTTGKVKI